MLNFDIQLFADGDHSTIDTANEKNIKITRLDNASGDLTVLYPITKIDNVEGLEEALKKTLSPYDSTSTYAVGDIVINPNGDGIYKCTTAIPTAEAWTEGHWTLIATKNYTNLTNKPTIPTDTWRNIKVKDTQILGTGINTGALNLKEGSNVTLTASGGDVTIAATDTNQTITAKNNGTGSAITFGANAPVELVQGSNVTITPDSTNNKITIAAQDTTYGIATKTVLGLVKSQDTGTTAGRDYNVEVNSSDGTMKVNVPWTDTTYESKAAAQGGTAVSLVTTGEKYTWNNKQDALQTQTAYTSKGSATKVPQITTNTLGQVTNITEVTITDNNDNQTIKGNGTAFGANDAIDIKGSGLISVTGNATNKDITISTSAQANVIETVQVNGNALTPTNKTVNITAADLGLDAALKFVGVSTTDPTSTTGATVSGHTTWKKGDVVLYNNLEYVNTTGTNTSSASPNPNWEELGDGASYALKTTKVEGAGALEGGGDLTQDRTITHKEILGTAKDTAGIYKVKYDKYGHVTEATIDNNVVESTNNLTTDKIVVGNSNNKTVKTSGVGIETSSTTTLTNVDTAVPTTAVLTRELGKKVDANTAITGATHTKITYDAKGLVTGGADLAESDIPALSISKITNLQTSLDNKLDDSQLKASWSSTTSDSNIPSEKLVKDSLDAKLDDSQLVTSWQSTHSDTKIPSEKLVATTKQDTLVSGTNIKTINNTSLLGSGNINTTSVTFVDWS